MKKHFISLLFLISINISFGQNRIIKKTGFEEFKSNRNKSILQNSKKYSSDKINIVLSNSNSTKIGVSKTALYPELDKREVSAVIPNENCNIYGVNYKRSFSEFDVFFPNGNLKSKIYPGALYLFHEIKNQSFTPNNYSSKRNSINLNTDIFTENTISNSSELKSFDFASINNSWNNLLASKIKGTTGGDISMFLTIHESKEQLKSEIETINSVDVGLKLDIPIPDLPITISPEVGVSTTKAVQEMKNRTNEKTYAVLKIQQTFYTSMISPKENNNGGFYSVFENMSSIPEDLMLISSVDYGRMFYIIISSSLSKEDLYKAISSKVSVNVAVGVSATGFPVGGKVTTNVTNEEKRKFDKMWENQDITFNVKQYGGVIINPVLKDGKPDLNATINQIYSTSKFSNDNIGSPIRYTLQFAKDYANAFVNVETNYATHNCGNTYNGKFDVEVTAKELYCKKAKGGSPDVYGSVDMINISCTNCKNKPESNNFNFWKRKGEDNAIEFDHGDSHSIRKTKTFKNLSVDEIKSLKFKLKADLKEADLGNNDKFESNKIYEFSVYNRSGNDPTTLEKILALSQNSPLKWEKIITCTEDGNKNNATIQVKFEIKITAK